MRPGLEEDIPEVGSNRKGMLAHLDASVIVARQPEIAGHVVGDRPQSTLIAKGFGEGFGLAQAFECLPEFAERLQRRAQLDSEIDRLLTCLARFWELLQGQERLLQVRHRLTVG
jgi:hypothetical protein